MSETDKIKDKKKGEFIVAANAFIFKEEKLLLTKRSSNRDHDPSKWECVSGRFNQHFSTVEDELLREVKEELGDNFKISLIAPISFYHFYRGDSLQSEMVGINYLCEYISGEIKLSDEHTSYQWIDPNQIDNYDTDPKLNIDINHLQLVKEIYFRNKQLLLNSFKKSN